MPELYLPKENVFDPATNDRVPIKVKERRYLHFDLPISKEDRECKIDFSKQRKPHRFWPLIGFTDTVRKYVSDKNGNKSPKVKERPIRYASHSDAAYLEMYANFLSRLYEEALKDDGSSESVLAYRRGAGSNIKHAKALFDEIVKRKDCTVIAMDISSFFDCLDHVLLRGEIARLVRTERLDGHHATVWKNITRYSWVESEELNKTLGKKRNRHGRICSPADFTQYVRGRKKGMVKKHNCNYGIPQGTPVSGLYANIYLRSFDQKLIDLCRRHDGSYRRYSDDIAIVLPLTEEVECWAAKVEALLTQFKLEISKKKTEYAKFRDGQQISEKPIQYLGFIFDGHKTLIRESSLAAYRQKMQKGIRAKLVVAKKKGIHPDEVYKRQLLSRYTHLSKGRNFLKYAYRASKQMKSKEIRQQVRSHMTWFKRVWDREVTRVYHGKRQ